MAVTVSLNVGCDHASCAEFAFPLFKQLRKGYEECSVLPLPLAVDEWRAEHRTARKRASRAERLGYRFARIKRLDFQEDVYAINTSLDYRQGRPMAGSYRDVPAFGRDDWACSFHAVHPYGVLGGSELVAYLWLYRSGDLALVSSILGHGDHLANDIMYLLVQGAIGQEAQRGGFMVYNRHDSGTDGLRFFKERLGFRPMEVAWRA